MVLGSPRLNPICWRKAGAHNVDKDSSNRSALTAR
jgi:hypothetical protein